MTIITVLDCVERTKKDSDEKFYSATVTWKDKNGFTNAYTGYSPVALAPGKKYEATIGYKSVTGSNGRSYKEPFLQDVSSHEVK